MILKISSSQIKAARSLLNWSAQDLAEESGVGVATIRRFEGSKGIDSASIKSLNAVKVCFEAAGIEFLGEPQKNPGVMLHIKL
jgi:transcriptional regulator with XRE-family HTH domain